MGWTSLRVYVTGGAGCLGQVVCRKPAERGYAQIAVPHRADYDLTQGSQVVRMYDHFEPDVVSHLAAEVGGIGANCNHPGRFFFANIAMGMYLIEHGRQRWIKGCMQAGTVCGYPKHIPVPFREQELWNGYPEETNAPYGVAKKVLFVMLDGYKREHGLNSTVIVPVNLYGPGDNFGLRTQPRDSRADPKVLRRDRMPG